MSYRQKKILQAIALIVIAIVLIRFYPLAFSFAEAAALGVREFWWLILIIALGAMVFHFTKNKKD